MTLHAGGSTSMGAQPPLPMSRKEAKVQGLTVFPSWWPCRIRGHGNMRRTSDNKCIGCIEAARELKAAIRERVLDQLKHEAMRKVAKEAAALVAEAEREAKGILTRAKREASDRARMLEKAKATREARKAAKASSPLPPADQQEFNQEASMGLPGDLSAPWD